MKGKTWAWIVGIVLFLAIIISFPSGDKPEDTKPTIITGAIVEEKQVNQEPITGIIKVPEIDLIVIPETINKPIEKETDTKESNNGLILVTRVIDGDTIEIEGGERIRLICINTPESGEEGYKEAKDFLRDSILNEQVKLVKDVTEEDKYGRLLRYIYLEDGTFVNELLARLGYGVAYPYGQDTSKCPLIENAERLARENNLGIWDTDKEPIKTDDNYVCSTNVYNCDDFSSHAEAQEVFEYCGGLGNDIHRLDGDEDGLACESLG